MSDTITTAARLRAAAALIEQHPDIPAPMVTAYTSGAVELDWFVNHGDDQRVTMQAIRRALGGAWDKTTSAAYFNLTTERDGLQLSILADREEVCTRRVVGTEVVTVPAVEAQPERTEVREVVEWDCEPVLAGESA